LIQYRPDARLYTNPGRFTGHAQNIGGKQWIYRVRLAWRQILQGLVAAIGAIRGSGTAYAVRRTQRSAVL
jgi:hypothetical protein